MTCDSTEPALVWEQSKDPSDTDDYAVDFEPALVNWWESGKQYLFAARVRVNGQPGFELECAIAGQSARRPPRITTNIGDVIVDGSVTWVVRAVTTISLVTTISGTPSWSASGLTFSNISVSGQKTLADIAGGIDGNDYSVVITANLANGKSRTVVCILKVRRAIRVCEA